MANEAVPRTLAEGSNGRWLPKQSGYFSRQSSTKSVVERNGGGGDFPQSAQHYGTKSDRFEFGHNFWHESVDNVLWF